MVGFESSAGTLAAGSGYSSLATVTSQSLAWLLTEWNSAGSTTAAASNSTNTNRHGIIAIEIARLSNNATSAVTFKKMTSDSTATANAPRVVQSKQGGGNSISGTLTITLDAGTTSGNSLIVIIGNNASDVDPSSITLGGVSLTKDAAKAGAASQAVSFWSLSNIAGGQTSVVITHSATWSPGVTVLEVPGLVTSSPFDVATAGGTSSAGSQSSFDSGSNTTNDDAELWLGCCVTFGTSGHTTITPTGSGTWTPFTNDAEGSFTDVRCAYQIVSTTGTLQYAGTLTSAAADWTALAVSYKAVASGVTGTVAVTFKKMTSSAQEHRKITGSSAVTFKKMTVSGSNIASYTIFKQLTNWSLTGDANPYTLGMQFSVSEDSSLTGIWFHSASGASILPAQCVLWNADTQTQVSGTLNTSPSWSGAAGSGWVRCAYDGSIALTPGTNYVVAVFYGSTGHNWYSENNGYWTSGAGASGKTNGSLTAPNSAGALNGQAIFHSGTSLTFPTTSVTGYDFGVDVEVEVTSSGVTGTSAVTFQKMTSSAQEHRKITSSSAVTFKKMTSTGAGTRRLTATSDVTFQKMTSAGAGTRRVTGTSAATFQKLTSSGAGSVTITGSSNITFQKLTSSVASKAIIDSTSAVTFKKMTVHARNAAPKTSSLFIFSPL
jgi:hypothetical protein